MLTMDAIFLDNVYCKFYTNIASFFENEKKNRLHFSHVQLQYDEFYCIK